MEKESTEAESIKRENEAAMARIRKLVAELRGVDGRATDGESVEPHPPLED